MPSGRIGTKQKVRPTRCHALHDAAAIKSDNLGVNRETRARSYRIRAHFGDHNFSISPLRPNVMGWEPPGITEMDGKVGVRIVQLVKQLLQNANKSPLSACIFCGHTVMTYCAFPICRLRGKIAVAAADKATQLLVVGGSSGGRDGRRHTCITLI